MGTATTATRVSATTNRRPSLPATGMARVIIRLAIRKPPAAGPRRRRRRLRKGMVAAATARTRRAATVATRRTRPVVMAMAVVVATRNRRATTRAAGIRQAGIRRVGMAAIETVGIRPDMGALPTPTPTRAADTVDPTAVATRMVAAAATDMVPRLSNRLDVAIESESVTFCSLANWPSRTANPSCVSHA